MFDCKGGGVCLIVVSLFHHVWERSFVFTFHLRVPTLCRLLKWHNHSLGSFWPVMIYRIMFYLLNKWIQLIWNLFTVIRVNRLWCITQYRVLLNLTLKLSQHVQMFENNSLWINVLVIFSFKKFIFLIFISKVFDFSWAF